MSAHTPGPWIAEGAEIVALVDPEHTATYYAPVCTIDDEWSTGIVEANARLIAAAPDLLAALQNMVAHFGHWASQIDMKQIDRDAVAMARAAIGKAAA